MNKTKYMLMVERKIRKIAPTLTGEVISLKELGRKIRVRYSILRSILSDKTFKCLGGDGMYIHRISLLYW